jgi:hypothetical protein
MHKTALHKIIILVATIALGTASVATEALARGGGGGGGHGGGFGGLHDGSLGGVCDRRLICGSAANPVATPLQLAVHAHTVKLPTVACCRAGTRRKPDVVSVVIRERIAVTAITCEAATA